MTQEKEMDMQLEEIMEFDEKDFSELSDDELEQVVGGAGQQLPATKKCPQCNNTMNLKGSGGHYVYFCKTCKKAFKVN